MLMSIPGQTMGVSVFTDPLLHELKLSRDELSIAYMLGTIASSFLLPWAGKKYDIWGGRILAIFSSLGLGLILLCLSYIDFLVFDVFQNASNQITIVIMVFCFMLLRFFGQGVLTLTSRNVMSEWFDKRRGFATGFSNVLVSLSFASAPAFLHRLIVSYEWSGAWRVMALLAGVIFPLFAYLLFRNKPEECGLKPDGNYEGEVKKQKQLFPVVHEFSKQEALRSYPFWIFALVLSIQGLYITGFSFHVVSIFQEAGFNESQAITIFQPAAVIGVVITLIFSRISDQIPLKYLLYLMGSGACICVLGMVLLGHWYMGYYFIIIGMGFTFGLFNILATVTWARYYGRKHLGAISGQVTMMMVFSSALGPIMFSSSLSIFGSYEIAGWVCLVAFLALTIAAIKADNPQKKWVNKA